jgi:hypothetical protein
VVLVLACAAPNPNDVVEAGADDGVDVPVPKAGFGLKVPNVFCGAGLDVLELVPAMLTPLRKGLCLQMLLFHFQTRMMGSSILYQIKIAYS